MIKSFDLFLILENFINESIVNYVSDFSDILKRMSSPIARDLLEMEGSDLEISTNFIKLNGPDSISFIPDKRSKDVRILDKVVSLDGFMVMEKFGKVYGFDPKYPNVGDLIYFVDHFDRSFVKSMPELQRYSFRKYMSEEGQVYVLIDGYQTSSLERNVGIGSNLKGQELKVGRFARKMMSLVGKKYSDSDVESFVNEFKSKIELSKNSFRNFSLVSGNEIKHWYLESSYYNEPRGSLHSSCMRYGSCQKYFDIYTTNPDVCSLLICKSDYDSSKITGRALVWKLDNGDTMMDRIYYSNQHDIQIFIEYARSMGWVYKSERGLICIGEDEERYSEDIGVDIKNWKFEYYPYLDTIPYLSDGHLSYDDNGDCVELTSTEGGNGEGCEVCGGSGEVECNECYGDGEVECSECGGSGSNTCTTCDGTHEIECESCDGTGKDGEEEDCPDCNGSGEIKCSDCNEDGEVDCEECIRGNITCGDCRGNGSVTCYECGG